jgi:hypothetical protein
MIPWAWFVAVVLWSDPTMTDHHVLIFVVDVPLMIIGR